MFRKGRISVVRVQVPSSSAKGKEISKFLSKINLPKE